MKLQQISSWDLFDNIKNKLNSSIIKSWLLEDGPITKRIKSSYEFKLELIQDRQLRIGGLIFAIIGFVNIYYVKN